MDPARRWCRICGERRGVLGKARMAWRTRIATMTLPRTSTMSRKGSTAARRIMPQITNWPMAMGRWKQSYHFKFFDGKLDLKVPGQCQINRFCFVNKKG